MSKQKNQKLDFFFQEPPKTPAKKKHIFVRLTGHIEGVTALAVGQSVRPIAGVHAEEVGDFLHCGLQAVLRHGEGVFQLLTTKTKFDCLL